MMSTKFPGSLTPPPQPRNLSAPMFAFSGNPFLPPAVDIISVWSLPKLDILVNNAGIAWDWGREVTEDGFELTFATNHLGHFLLTDLLVPILKESAESGFTPRKVYEGSAPLCVHHFLFELLCCQGCLLRVTGLGRQNIER